MGNQPGREGDAGLHEPADPGSKRDLEASIAYLDVVLKELKSQVERLSAGNQQGFRIEYEGITAGKGSPAVDSLDSKNIELNRYRNVVAYDHSRVKVTPNAANNFSDYINANYMNGHNGEHSYIAAQGPVPAGFAAFWQMVLQENCNLILMITNEVENDKLKCHRYWPDHKQPKMEFDTLTIEYVSERAHATYIERAFTVSEGSQSRSVTQLAYTAWPDHGVPSTTAEMLAYRKVVKRMQDPSAPLLVHCSAGVGRTGTYIAIDRLMRSIDKREQDMTVASVVSDMRARRNFMVQTLVQYKFIYKAMFDAVAKELKKAKKELKKLGMTIDERALAHKEEIEEIQAELQEAQEHFERQTGVDTSTVEPIQAMNEFMEEQKLTAAKDKEQFEAGQQPKSQPQEPVALKDPQPPVVHARYWTGKSTDDVALANKQPRLKRMASLMDSQKEWLKRGNVPLAVEDKGYKKEQAAGLDKRLESLKMQARDDAWRARYDAAKDKWTNSRLDEVEEYDFTKSLTPVESRMQSLASQMEAWKLRGDGFRSQVQEDARQQLLNIGSRLTSLVADQTTWRKRGDGMRGKKVVQDGVREHTERDIGSLANRLQTLKDQEYAWRTKGDGFRGEAPTPIYKSHLEAAQKHIAQNAKIDAEPEPEPEPTQTLDEDLQQESVVDEDPQQDQDEDEEEDDEISAARRRRQEREERRKARQQSRQELSVTEGDNSDDQPEEKQESPTPDEGPAPSGGKRKGRRRQFKS
eukprot:m.142574 g.142574  ORF g.142574 m.142574 type:complete len:750 (+) comp24186_c3_seq4:108-2357(+)